MDIKLDRYSGSFSLEYTLNCGQLFRWQKIDDWWYGVVGENVIKIKQNERCLIVHSFPESLDKEYVENYLRLDDNLLLILLEINKDEYTREAIAQFNGLRLCRQDTWECLISYLCATYKNIPAIKRMIFNISKQFGTKLIFDGHDFYTFPKPSSIAQASQKELRACGLGFRTERILETAKIIEKAEFDLESLKNMKYLDAKNRLLDLPGVGYKVADCILLFSLDKLESFPIDVWMKRAATNLYSGYFDSKFIDKVTKKGSITPKEYEIMNSFGRKYFGRFAGYAQEYLFHLLRTRKLSK
jgi:N-glycosylase/DNA lyase